MQRSSTVSSSGSSSCCITMVMLHEAGKYRSFRRLPGAPPACDDRLAPRTPSRTTPCFRFRAGASPEVANASLNRMPLPVKSRQIYKPISRPAQCAVRLSRIGCPDRHRARRMLDMRGNA
jgi:hypothetical protein